MYDGVDRRQIEKAMAKVDKMIEDCVIPGEYNYDFESSIQLLQARVIDFTNRNAVVTAEKYGFDREGFKQGRPLTKRLFYRDPYLTCSWCNELMFIDVDRLHQKMTLPLEIGDRIQSEYLPNCEKCKRADCYVIGSHDFSEIIAKRDEVEKIKREKELSASIIIKRVYRAYLKRRYATAAAAARLARKLLEKKAATIIAALVRRRLARRRFNTEKELVSIKHSHPVLTAWAIRGDNTKKQLFWFTKQVELDMLYFNYIDLIERKGFDPSRYLLEENVREISARIIERKSILLALIQRVWRGFMARRIVKYYRTEVIRMRQYTISRILMIQRAYRGHAVRVKMPKFIALQRREKLMSKYQDQAMKQLKGSHLKQLRDTMMESYAHERREERTARFTQRIDLPQYHDNKKMKAFAASCYYDDKLQLEIDDLMGLVVEKELEERETVQAELARRRFLDGRIAEHGPVGFGLRGVKPPDDKPVIVNGFRVSKIPESSRSTSMRIMFDDERKHLMDNLIERTVKDHSMFNRGALQRFEEYNLARKKRDNIVNVEPVVSNKAPVSLRRTTTRAATPDGAVDEEKEKKTSPSKPKFRKIRSETVEFRPRDYKFPANINDKPTEWLFEDDGFVQKYK